MKGYHVGHILYGKDRLTTPLLRKDGKLVPISWDEAIETIAKRIQAAPAKFAFYGSGQWTIPEGYAANKFMKGGLANNHIDPNARLCMASAVTGYISTYGVDEPSNCYDDLDHCDVLILWGNNIAEMHPVLFSRFIDRKLKGDKVTLIDLTTRRTRTSERADHVLMFQPQSDLAIANCIAQLVIAANAVATEFVDEALHLPQAVGEARRPADADRPAVHVRRVQAVRRRVHARSRSRRHPACRSSNCNCSASCSRTSRSRSRACGAWA